MVDRQSFSPACREIVSVDKFAGLTANWYAIETATQRGSPWLLVPLGVILLAGAAALAENTDPEGDGSQYAYGENVGWLNAEPLGDGGPGMQVNGSELTGYLWGENIGWIGLSCENTASCATVSYGVQNDGCGSLTGYAWAENVGWISFSCFDTASCATAAYGVNIDAQTGEFSGNAWSENTGWITFASSGPNAFRVRTSWRGAGPPTLTVTRSGTNSQLSWTAPLGATGYDVVQGDLVTLRSSEGDFSQATTGCLADNSLDTTLTDSDTPAPGVGLWLLVRPANCGAPGTYDSGGAMQVGLRDAEINASGNDCP